MDNKERERLTTMETKLDNLCENMNKGFNRVNKEVAEINAKFDRLAKMYVTRHEFQPVRNVVYGLVGGILVTVLGAILKVVIVG